MNSTDVPRPVFLPSDPSWNAQAHLVGEVLHTMAAAAARTLDDTRYLVPALTWQVAADQVRDCVTADHHPDRLRILLLPAHALEAIWSCRTALARTTGHDDAERLAGLLDSYLDPVHDIGLPGLMDALDQVLAVLTLDLPAARTLATRVALNSGIREEDQEVLDEIRAAWRRTGTSS
ncbi:hypothetical protein [Streptomyces filamentosus]|uniref:hypothetical protein n=1 Tax=Streptomyces filamentosus TaxID=67294 RepID=UPI0033FADCF3